MYTEEILKKRKESKAKKKKRRENSEGLWVCRSRCERSPEEVRLGNVAERECLHSVKELCVSYVPPLLLLLLLTRNMWQIEPQNCSAKEKPWQNWAETKCFLGNMDLPHPLSIVHLILLMEFWQWNVYPDVALVTHGHWSPPPLLPLAEKPLCVIWLRCCALVSVSPWRPIRRNSHHSSALFISASPKSDKKQTLHWMEPLYVTFSFNLLATDEKTKYLSDVFFF